MSQQKGIVKGDPFQKLSSVSLVVAGILLIIFNILLPRANDPSKILNLVNTWGSKAGLVRACTFFLSVGIWALMIGVAGIYRSITERGAAFAHLGFYVVTVGTTLFTLSFASVMATATAPDRAIAAVIATMGNAVFTMSILVEWLAIAFTGIGMVASSVYPKWQGWAAVALGFLTFVVVGIPQFFNGQTAALQMVFAVLAVLSTIWALVVGIQTAQKAW